MKVTECKGSEKKQRLILCSLALTTSAIFSVRQMQEENGSKGKKLYLAFVDLEKALDRVPEKVAQWALEKGKSGEMVGEWPCTRAHRQ